MCSRSANAFAFSLLLTLLCLVFGSGSAAANQFGYRGQDGAYGRDGADGRSGPDATIYADGGYYRYDLRGDEGYPGQDGRDGQSATSCYQPQNVAYDLYGAEGGSGGNAGNGGNGGNGGDMVVYYNELASLRQVYVDASGGRGSEPGRNGRGGYGCNCTTFQWQVGDRVYHCSNGREGTIGSYGRDGEQGNSGAARLISQLTPLPAEHPSRQISLATLSDAEQTISRHLWTQRAGAATLFAPGSRVANIYVMYTGTQRATYTLDWTAERPVEDFGETKIGLYFGQSGPAVSISDEIWTVHNLNVSGTSASLSVSDAIKVTEVRDLKWDKFSGSGRDLSVAFTDGAPDDAVHTDFSVSYYTRGLALWRLRFEGGVDDSLITREGNRYVVNIGRLNIHPDYLRPGTSFLIDVRAKRSFAAKSLTINYERQHQIQ